MSGGAASAGSGLATGLATGLDRLLGALARGETDLPGRRYGLLAHAASLTADLVPAHRALAASPAGPAAALFGPEHGYYAVEQDMVAAEGGADPWTGAPLVSLYGDSEDSLRPRPQAFDGLDLLLVDLQDVGSRYYTYAATAVWAAEVALEAGLEVWILDRPNPLGGRVVEGNLPEEGFESFVSAFRLPIRHGLTLGEVVRLEASWRGWPQRGVEIWEMTGWTREMLWSETGRPWIAPSPNMPTELTSWIYPGGCLIEATEISEGRGTTRPFQLVGAPGVDPVALAGALDARKLPGCGWIPTYFRPQFQKHAGAVCGGVEWVVTDPATLRAARAGFELLAALRAVAPEAFAWRREPYEFVIDRPAIDLLAGGTEARRALEAGEGLTAWLDSWAGDEEVFLAERRPHLLYPEGAS